MISDEERKEIAERLRVYSHDFDFSDSDPFWYVSKAAFGDVDVHTYCSVFARLADLIDVPTTVLDLTETMRTVHGEKVRGWECRECGQGCEEMYGEYEYCPHCRRKVVEP